MLQKKINIYKILTCATSLDGINLHCCNIFRRCKPNTILHNRTIYPWVTIINEIHFNSINEIDINVS